MAITETTYFGLTRVREQSPEGKDWAAVDANPEIIAKLIHAFAQHSHNGAAGTKMPGYNSVDPVSSLVPTLTFETATTGVITPGTSVGVRLSYIDAMGLETDATRETNITIPPAASRPLPPRNGVISPSTGGLAGGAYAYVITKVKAGGETTPSDVLTVMVPYDTTYSITIDFDSLVTQTDAPTAINIYRASGLAAPFQLIAQIAGPTGTNYTTTGTVTTFVDTNAAVIDQSAQPPANNTFDANRRVLIDWSNITVPPSAKYLRVYVTQQTGLWSTDHLLSEIDLSAAPGSSIYYLGTERLAPGWPLNSSQIADAPPKINLTTDAVGAPTLTANMDFAGFQALGFRLENRSGAPPTPTAGKMYYDTSINNARAYINGAWVNWGVAASTAYSHPAEEAGGHVAANIRFLPGSAVTAKTIFDTMRNTDGTQKNQTKIYKVVGSTGDLTTQSTSATGLTDMDITNVTPNFNSQWAEATFIGHIVMDTLYATITVAIEYDGSTIEETVKTQTAGAVSTHHTFTIPYTFQLGTTAQAKRVRVLWWVSAGTAKSIVNRRSLVVKVLP